MVVQSWRPTIRKMTIVSHPGPLHNIAGCCTLGEFLSPKGFGIWIYLFQGDMFSYKSISPRNLNHSIRVSDGQVKAKIQSWVEGET